MKCLFRFYVDILSHGYCDINVAMHQQSKKKKINFYNFYCFGQPTYMQQGITSIFKNKIKFKNIKYIRQI
jgi:hypothetical protein